MAAWVLPRSSQHNKNGWVYRDVLMNRAVYHQNQRHHRLFIPILAHGMDNQHQTLVLVKAGSGKGVNFGVIIAKESKLDRIWIIYSGCRYFEQVAPFWKMTFVICSYRVLYASNNMFFHFVGE
eukprot:712382_1